MATTIIKGLHLLSEVLTPEQLERLEQTAAAHRRHARIFFKVLDVDADQKALTLCVKQELNPSEVYADALRLADIANETFAPLLSGWAIHKRPMPYDPSPCEIVTAKWVRAQMLRLHIGNKTLAHDLGFTPSAMSAMVNEHHDIGKRARAMFFYYFRSKDLERASD